MSNQKFAHPWCVVFINATNVERYGEIFEVGAIGCDGLEFHSLVRPEARMSKHCYYDPEELEKGSVDWKGFTKFLSRYDAVITWNAWYLAPKIEKYLPTSVQKKAGGSKQKHTVFCCAMTQLEWPDTCLKLSCLSGVSDKDNRNTLDRCKTLLKLLKLEKVNLLLDTVDVKYYLISPVFVAPQDRWLLRENGFQWHYTKPIKYATTKEVSEGFPFEVYTLVFPRKNMYVSVKE